MPPPAYWPPPYWGVGAPPPPWGPPVPGQTMPMPGLEGDQQHGIPPPAWARDDAPGGMRPPPVPSLSQGADGSADDTAAVRLRGLPFTATEQDVLAFFAKHDVVERVHMKHDAVKMISKANGKPSGQAVVLMLSRTDAYVAQQVLNGQYMGTRYIEVFQQTEGEDVASKANAGPIGPGQAMGSTTGGTEGVLAQPPPISAHTKAPSPEAFNPFDGLSDTGGSGGAAVPGNMAFNSAAMQANLAVMNYFAQPGLGGGQLAPPDVLCSRLSPPEAPTPSTGASTSASPQRGEDAEKESSWEALFDFLKRDNVEPPMPSAAALQGLGAPGSPPEFGTPNI